MKSGSRKLDFRWLVCLLLATTTLLVYLPVRNHDFISYDDPIYVTGNRYVQAGLTWAGVKWAFTTGHDGNWFPLTWLSHMADVQLFGTGPAGPHLVNLLFHIANTVLMFVVLLRMTGTLWRSAIIAALFALHPLHVESVAWIAERKDVLSAFLGLLSLLAYVRYAQSRSIAAFGLSLLFFALGLMSKPMLVTLPFALLLFDYWPLKRLEADNGRMAILPLVREKIPYFLLSAFSCWLTLMVQQKGGAVQSLANFSLSERIGNALVSYARYLGKTVWPVDLATPYPHPGHWSMASVLLSSILLASLCLGALGLRRRFPFVTMGWFLFFGMMIPTIGLVQVGDQSMADRYTYLPLIGVFIALVWSATELLVCWRWSKLGIGMIAGLVVAACAVQTRDQLRHWRNSDSLFRHSLALTQGNFLAHNNLGCALLERREGREAIFHFEKALEIKPDYVAARVNLGDAFHAEGRSAEAIAEYEKALHLRPDSMEAHYNLGNILLQNGATDAAIAHFEIVVQNQPDHFYAENNLANALLKKGRLDEAIRHYRAAVVVRPDFVVARHNLGLALLQSGQADEAVAHFRKIVELQPSGANVHNNLGWILRQTGQFDEAMIHFQKALEIQPQYPEAHDNLAKALLLKGQAHEALEHFRIAVKQQPNDPRNLADLAWLLATWPEASVRNSNEALQLALQANQLSGDHDAEIVHTLAAAYAESGRFGEAVATARRALELAEGESNAALARELRLQLKCYEAYVPFRDGLKSDGKSLNPS